MAFDPAAYGWTTIFIPKKDVTLPPQMTKANWDKKKQAAAKLTKTGIGEQLKKVEDAFKKVLFANVEFSPHPHKVQEQVDTSKKFITSAPVKSLHQELMNLKNLAKKHAAAFKKNPLTKKTGELLDEIHTVGDTLMVCINPNSLSGALSSAIEHYEKTSKQASVDKAPEIVAMSQKIRDKIAGKIQSLRTLLAKFDDEKERSKMYDGMYTLARDMTQSLGNMMKAHKAGVAFQGFDAGNTKALLDKLTQYGGVQTHNGYTKDLNQVTAGKLIDSFEGFGSDYISLTKNIKMPAKIKV